MGVGMAMRNIKRIEDKDLIIYRMIGLQVTGDGHNWNGGIGDSQAEGYGYGTGFASGGGRGNGNWRYKDQLGYHNNGLGYSQGDGDRAYEKN